MQQLELNKPVVEEKKYYNLPLLFFLFILSSGLLIVGYGVYDNTKISMKEKCIGCLLVGFGITAVLIRILFSYSPSFVHELKNIANDNCNDFKNNYNSTNHENPMFDDQNIYTRY